MLSSSSPLVRRSSDWNSTAKVVGPSPRRTVRPTSFCTTVKAPASRPVTMRIASVSSSPSGDTRARSPQAASWNSVARSAPVPPSKVARSSAFRPMRSSPSPPRTTPVNSPRASCDPAAVRKASPPDPPKGRPRRSRRSSPPPRCRPGARTAPPSPASALSPSVPRIVGILAPPSPWGGRATRGRGAATTRSSGTTHPPTETGRPLPGTARPRSRRRRRQASCAAPPMSSKSELISNSACASASAARSWMDRPAA